jgi:hypothetical protein
MFPAGLPGLALLILRASVVTAAILDGCGHRPELSGWTLGALALPCLALSVGFLTPIAATLVLICHVLASSNLSGGAGLDSIAVLDALVLVLIGPGAYSIDARRFGRRLVVLPPD